MAFSPKLLLAARPHLCPPTMALQLNCEPEKVWFGIVVVVAEVVVDDVVVLAIVVVATEVVVLVVATEVVGEDVVDVVVGAV